MLGIIMKHTNFMNILNIEDKCASLYGRLIWDELTSSPAQATGEDEGSGHLDPAGHSVQAEFPVPNT